MNSIFSPFSEVVILFSLSAPAWFVLLLFWSQSPRRAIGAAVAMIAWAAFGMAVIRYGWDMPPFGSSPVRALFQLAVPTLLILLAARWLTTPPIPQRALIVLAVAGIADFISAFSFGFLSAASPVQLFAFDLPNTVNEYPLGLIPNTLVPVAVAAHILSLAQLSRVKTPKPVETDLGRPQPT